MSLLDEITGGKSSEASADLEKALAAIQGVKTPTVAEMEYQVQKLVQAGILSPEQARTFLQSPNAMLMENIPQTGTQAQETAIADLLSAAKEGGLNPDMQAKMGEIIRQLNTQERGANEAVVQKQAERGALTGGETLAAQLQNIQNASANANQAGLETAKDAYDAMLQELTSAGSLGSGLQGQENTQANTVAAATNAINQFNAAQQQQQENFNVGNRNQAQAENLANAQNIENTNVGNANEYARYQAQLPEEVYQNQLDKAKAEADVAANQAQQATQQGGQQAGLIGGIIGTGGEVAGNWQSNQNPKMGYEGGEVHEYLSGGEVEADNPHERALIDGNSPKNDRIPAILSEGEIVLPRTIAKNPEPDRVMAFLNRIRQKKDGPPPIHPEDTAHVLKALTLARSRS